MYLDANFFIFANFSQDEKGIQARALLKEIIQGKKAITSALALDEVMWVLLKNKHGNEIKTIIEEIYSIPYLEIKEVPADIPLKAIAYMENYKLKPRDAFHAAIMHHFNEHTIASDDADFDRIPSIQRIDFGKK